MASMQRKQVITPPTALHLLEAFQPATCGPSELPATAPTAAPVGHIRSSLIPFRLPMKACTSVLRAYSLSPCTLRAPVLMSRLPDVQETALCNVSLTPLLGPLLFAQQLCRDVPMSTIPHTGLLKTCLK